MKGYFKDSPKLLTKVYDKGNPMDVKQRDITLEQNRDRLSSRGVKRMVQIPFKPSNHKYPTSQTNFINFRTDERKAYLASCYKRGMKKLDAMQSWFKHIGIEVNDVNRLNLKKVH